jgi:hypothetical protein
MKLRFSIGFIFLIFLSWFILFTGASNENETITSLMDLNTNVLGLIINELLTIQDILTLRTTCQFFENLLRPNDKGMLDFCNYAESKRIINVNLYWINLEYFLNESYDNALHKMKIFTISKDQYALLTRAPDQKIISWFKKKVTNNIHSEPVVRVHTKGNNKNVWVEFIKGGSVQNMNGEHKKLAHQIPDDLLLKMKKIKTIVSTACAFAVLLDNGDVFAWGHKRCGGLIPDEIQTKLKNIKMIYSNYGAFVAVSKNGEAYSWGYNFFEGGNEILFNIDNVKMICSIELAFAALLNDGSVCTWGSTNWGGKISSETQSKLKNVKMIVSNNRAFVALIQGGGSVSWGNDFAQERLKKLLSQFYNIK